MSRRAFDFYPTPGWATEALLKRVPISGRVLECCAGAGDISRALGGSSCRTIVTNDIDPKWPTWHTLDARLFETWEYIGPPRWTVSNPPFSCALPIVQQAVRCSVDGVAMLLRLSFLEPTKDRGPWLAEHPPTRVIVLPRISFTGDGKTDSVTCAWLAWERGVKYQQIVVVPKSKRVWPLEATA